MKLKRNSSYGVGALCAAMLLAGSASAAAGDASLDRLEIKLDGKNIISSFNKNQLNYEITLDEDAATTATFSASPSSASSVLATDKAANRMVVTVDAVDVDVENR